MPPLRLLIVEDEMIIARDLEEQLVSFGYSVVGIAQNSQTAIRLFSTLLPDLVLMDIYLRKSELDGIQLAQIFDTLHPVPIIFLTGVQDPVVYERAITTSPANYLFKPCNEQQLQAAIKLAIYNSLKNGHIASAPPTLETELFLSNDYIFIREKELFVKLSINDLLWVKAANTYVEIFTEHSQQLLTTSLKSFLQQFPHRQLHRVHRSYAVNLSKVDAFDGGNVYINHQNKKHRIPVASPFREQIFAHFPKLKTRP